MNDILKPELIWIEGRCYRVNDANIEISALQEHDLYDNEIMYNDTMENDNDDDNNFEVEPFDDTNYFTNFHVSKHYLGSVIGKKGATKSRIEHDTKTEIKIPKHGQTGDILILGHNPANVKAARRRINIIVMSSRMKQKFTHFISIPMNSQDIKNKFTEFKECVLRECSSRGLEESLFIEPNKLHLTVGVMCLMDNEERLYISKLFTEAKEKIIIPLLQDYLPFRIRLKGLSYMNDDPQQIDVLYGRVEEDGCPLGLLQDLIDQIVQYFYKAGYMDKEFGRDNVKMHVTLINSKYRSRSSNKEEHGNQPRNRRVRETFDGSEILQKFADYDFGVQTMNEIHLSQRHSIGSDGYYQPTCVLPIRV